MNINLIKIRFFTLDLLFCYVAKIRSFTLSCFVQRHNKQESVKDLILIRLNQYEQDTPMMYEQDYGTTLQRTCETHLIFFFY